ncbi:MAG: hypothetical protein CL862_13360 [Cyanobium sp. NAT70]|nr:hypothetical protein [Cyanobium sp. NAT70]
MHGGVKHEISCGIRRFRDSAGDLMKKEDTKAIRDGRQTSHLALELNLTTAWFLLTTSLQISYELIIQWGSISC